MQIIHESSLGHMTGTIDSAPLLRAYDQLAPAVTPLILELGGSKSVAAHPDYLETDNTTNVFRLAYKGGEYVARVANANQADPLQVDRKLQAGTLAADIPHLEQIVAGSAEHDVTIARRMLGRKVEQLDGYEVDAITAAQLDEFIDTIAAAHGAGIKIDPRPNNIVYDRSAGFGIINYDLNRAADEAVAPQTYRDALEIIPKALTNAGVDPEPAVLDPEQGFAVSAHLQVAKVRALQTYLSVVQARPDRGVFDDVEREITKILAAEQAYLDALSDQGSISGENARRQALAAKLANLTELAPKQSD